MTYISTESNIRCIYVQPATPDEEREIRDKTRYRARQIALGRDLDKKQYMPYRLVNGIPFDNTNIRSNEYLQDSGMCLLDFDMKDSPQNRYDLVWKRIKPHLKDWHILHFERSLSGGCHATVRMPEGLTRKQVIRLFELRLQLPIDHCHDLARACFLVPNEYVMHTTDEYYQDKPLKPVPLADTDRQALYEDEEQQRVKLQERITRANITPDKYQESPYQYITRICDILDEQRYDITWSYDRWYRICFCLANELGEDGRQLFHRLSHHHPEYDYRQTDRRYTEQLQANNGSITLGSFIHFLREDGLVPEKNRGKMPDCGNILLTSQNQSQSENKMEERTPATQHPRRRHSYYLNPVMELVHANERYTYTYINNLKYSEKLYKALRQAMETKSATPIDLFVHSITFRAEAINSGYNSLTEQGNYLCAIALIRMQIDNFLMAWAGLLSKDRDKFYLYYNTGRPVNQLTDAQGNKLTQGYLVNTFAEREPSVKEIYQSGNEYIHPSHIFQEESISLTSGIQLLSYRDHECSEETKREARRHMLIANNLLASVLVEWVHLKHGRDNIQNSDNT